MLGRRHDRGASESVEAAAPAAGTAKTPRVPKQPARLREWREIYRLLRPQIDGARTVAEMASWLRKAHPRLERSPYVIAEIIRAGEAGLLK